MPEELLVSGLALWPDGGLREAHLRLANGVIQHMAPGLDATADLHAEGYLAPGFIELQINGAFGVDLTFDATGLAQVAHGLPAQGVTSFLPTVITSAWGAYPQRLKEIREAGQASGGARSLGLHLEGPFLNPQRKGAHNPAHLRAVNLDEMVRWADPEQVRVVTLAPELPGALEAIRTLSSRGIRVSAGHSNATYEQAQRAFDAGIAWGTHLFNAMPPLGHREPGLAGALLASDVPCGLIVDGIHVHPGMVKLVYQAKGVGGITLVTDAMEAMGMPAGTYRLGQFEVIVSETDARLADGTLAGSILTMDAAVRNMVAYSGCPVAEALQMAALTPAAMLGDLDVGRLDIGCRADLVLLTDELVPQVTLVGGEVVYTKED